MVRRHSQFFLDGEVVHFDHHAIDLIGKFVAHLFKGKAIVGDCTDPPKDLFLFLWTAKADVPQQVEGTRVCLQWQGYFFAIVHDDEAHMV